MDGPIEVVQVDSVPGFMCSVNDQRLLDACIRFEASHVNFTVEVYHPKKCGFSVISPPMNKSHLRVKR